MSLVEAHPAEAATLPPSHKIAKDEQAGSSALKLMLALTLMLAGRAMTLAYISEAGSGAVGAPPAAWLMPLIGDAVIGVSALGVAYVIWKRTGGLYAWTGIVVWNALAIWDALSAYVVNTTTPWPSFFMLKTFGASMFFMASGMHLVCLYLAFRKDVRAIYVDSRD